MAPVDPLDYPIDAERYRQADLGWLDELDRLSVHSGEPHQRMGTRAIDEAGWLVVDDLREEELALRRRLWCEATDEVVTILPGSDAACLEAAGAVDAWLAEHDHPRPAGDAAPAAPVAPQATTSRPPSRS